MDIRVPDMEAWKSAKKDVWLPAWELWPYGYTRREYRAKRMVQLGMCISRMNGHVEEFYVSSKFSA